MCETCFQVACSLSLAGTPSLGRTVATGLPIGDLLGAFQKIAATIIALNGIFRGFDGQHGFSSAGIHQVQARLALELTEAPQPTGLFHESTEFLSRQRNVADE